MFVFGFITGLACGLLLAVLIGGVLVRRDRSASQWARWERDIVEAIERAEYRGH